MKYYEQYVDYVYNIVKMDTEDMDAIYKDYILQMVGVYGFNALYGNDLIESCGVINGRQLFALCAKKPINYPEGYDELLEENKKLKEMILKGF